MSTVPQHILAIRANMEKSPEQRKYEIETAYPNAKQKGAFRMWRAIMLAKYDVLRLNVQNGDIDPKTNQPYPEITDEEKQWRLAVLNFTDQITHETTEADYPQPPERLR